MTTANLNSFSRPAYNQYYNNEVLAEGEDFLDYLMWLGLLGESNLLVLSMKHNYYFDQNDLNEIRVLVIPKKMNMIKHPDSFLHITYRVLPPEAYYIGCFTEDKNPLGKKLPLLYKSADSKRFINSLDSDSFRDLNKSIVSQMLESHGFRTVDMTEIKGLVYFACRNRRISA